MNLLSLDGFSGFQLLVVALAMFFGGLTKGIIGIALPMIALTILLLAFEPQLAVALMVIPICVTNVQLALSQGVRQARQTVTRFFPLIVTGMASVFAVSLFAAGIPPDKLLVVLGVVVACFVVLNLSRWRPQIAPERERRIGAVTGVVSGLVGGVTSVYGPPITMFLIAARVPKHMWSVSVGVTFGLIGIPLVLGYALNGLLTGPIALVSLLGCVPAYLGLWLGMRLQNALPPEMFRKLLLGALFIAALNLVRRGLF